MLLHRDRSRPAWTARARTSRAPALPDRGFGFPTAPPGPDEIVPWSPAVAAQPNPAAGLGLHTLGFVAVPPSRPARVGPDDNVHGREMSWLLPQSRPAECSGPEHAQNPAWAALPALPATLPREAPSTSSFKRTLG